MLLPEARVAPPLTPLEAEWFAAQLYGLTVRASPLPGEYDDNFHLQASDSRSFTLKVMHPARPESFVDMQCRALLHLSRKVPYLVLPRVLPNLRGEFFSRIQLEGGSERLVWLLTFVEGKTLAEANPHTGELLGSLGRYLGQIDAALADFSHPATRRELKWDLSRSLWARDYLHFVCDPKLRLLASKFLDLYEQEVLPRLPHLRHSVIYGDANDHNAIVSPPWPQPRCVRSLIDFGDLHWSPTVAEPAIAAAYALLNEERPLPAASAVLSGYHEVFPIGEQEIAVFYPLLCARLAVSVVNSAYRQSLAPDDPYVTVSEAPAWASLERLGKIHPRLAHYTFRSACGFAAHPDSARIQGQLSGGKRAAPVLPRDIQEGNCLVLDLSVGSPFLGADPRESAEPLLSAKIQSALRAARARLGIGGYLEPRSLYRSDLFSGPAGSDGERRTVHLGIDLFADSGTTVCAPLDGFVHAFADNTAVFDYGPVIILRHCLEGNLTLFTLYGHLSRECLARLRVGQAVSRGAPFAQIGTSAENGGYPAHLHFQIILDLLDLSTDFPGVAFASEQAVYASLSPDPNLLLNLPRNRFPAARPDFDATLAARHQLLGKNLSLSYDRPLKIVRGWRQYLFDETGRAYLDAYNNVPLVGHSHPTVVAAVQQQMALLNTNTRYLHDHIIRYAERLTALLPAPLQVLFFLNSGSEANELALRLARTHTQREDVIVLEHAYHGHTSALIDISPYKFRGPGGRGQKSWVHVAPLPDDYRGPYRRGEDHLAAKYAAPVADILHRQKNLGHEVAAYIAETMPSVAGQIVFPAGYLEEAYRHARAAGAVCIADEVQVGFGRLGTHFWGFEAQQVVPDIVVFGKPMGNGFPLAAVVTTREIADSFANGMEFFATFGGNPVACAAGLAVLDVLRDERLQENALQVGSLWRKQLRALQSDFPIVGDVRGAGLFLGIDLVEDRKTRAPATRQASYIVNRLRDNAILAGTDGPHHNVIKLRPPLLFATPDAELFTSTFRRILREDPAQPS